MDNEAIFSVYAALDDLYKCVASPEKNMPDYLADLLENLLEIGRNIEYLDKRLTELEITLDTTIATVEKSVEG